MLRRIVVVLVVCVPVGLSAAGVSAAACPNEGFRVERGMTALPECRAYEQVSPVDKNGADALGYETNVRSAVHGDRVTFASFGGFAQAEGLKTFEPYFASRGSQGWSASALYPPQEPQGTGFINDIPQPFGYDEELQSAVMELTDPAPPGVSGAQPGVENLYVRNLATGAYTLLTTAGVTLFTSVGFSAGSHDFSHVLFESPAKLTPDAPVNNPNALSGDAINLYEAVNGKVRLVGILPNGQPAPLGARAGVASESPTPISGGGIEQYYTQNTISADGSVVFWTDEATDQLYARVEGTSTVHVSASQRSEPDPGGTQPAYFRGATRKGTEVLFTSGEKLTNDSTALSSNSTGGDLYAYQMPTTSSPGHLTDLTVVKNGGSAQVLGVLGTGEDETGLSVYFVAGGAPLAPGATPQAELFETGRANIYVWHAGKIHYIATVQNAGTNPGEDTINWEPYTLNNVNLKLSRVTPSGLYLLFASTLPLTA
ncbi:MAG: hypothetical protein JWO21_1281, partial [Solirubrobacterales bacterium]|nr:hypothetical protein [Solirubrobacterales bacterium]